MTRILLALLTLSLVPGMAFASTVRADRTLVVSEALPDNAYLAGTDVNIAAALLEDLLALGGTLTVSAPVGGDATLVGGSIRIDRPVAGDVRAAAGHIAVSAPVGGDLVLGGGTVEVSGTASSTRIAGGTVRLTGGAGGPVVLYGADVHIAGEFVGNVEVVASDAFTVAEGTIIHGTLEYNAPQQAELPASAVVDGGVEYTGSASYLPTNEEAKTFALAGAGVFFIVRVIAAVIAAGLLAGLFPVFTRQIVDRTLTRSPRRFVLHALLGFAAAVAAPVLILILMLSFVGLAVAFMLGLAYLLLLMLGFLYAGILAGAALMRGLLKRQHVSWRAAVLGMLVLYLIGVIPGFGALVVLILMAAAMGSILSITYSFAFSRNDDIDLPVV